MRFAVNLSWGDLPSYPEIIACFDEDRLDDYIAGDETFEARGDAVSGSCSNRIA
ncbi:MAG: hypothetical protein A4E63_02051 [Syntrophorhabdus sp. PtaU1.Bin050]|nr:MAG: hypothetical protein A4E63_02051 [Syntrophorhabdus sp. PtaU1.Bin050]